MDKWFAEDKWNHVAGSFFGTFLFYYLLHWVLNPYADILLSSVLCFVAGFFVEIVQATNKIRLDKAKGYWLLDSADDFSFKDICANVVGILLACWIFFVV
jgi:hypothetical protein